MLGCVLQTEAAAVGWDDKFCDNSPAAGTNGYPPCGQPLNSLKTSLETPLTPQHSPSRRQLHPGLASL